MGSTLNSVLQCALNELAMPPSTSSMKSDHYSRSIAAF